MRAPEINQVIERSRRRRSAGGEFIPGLAGLSDGLWLRADTATTTTPGADALAGLDVLTAWGDVAGGPGKTPSVFGLPTLETVGGKLGVRMRTNDYLMGAWALGANARMTMHVMQVPDPAVIASGCGVFDTSDDQAGSTNQSFMALSENGMVARISNQHEAKVAPALELAERQLWTYDWGPTRNRLYLNGELVAQSAVTTINHVATTYYRVGRLFQVTYYARRVFHELLAVPRQMTDDERDRSGAEIMARWA